MDFFSQQTKARRRTGLLIFYFVCAIVLITLSVNVAVFMLMNAGGFIGNGLDTITKAPVGQLLQGPFWVWTSLFTVSLIGLGSLFSFLKLAGGGRAVARMVDARLVDLSTTDPREKRLINLVEEMSIASGTPVPEIYIQDGELGINAFVAGYQIRESVLVVTEGALAKLTRDELQGVIGHEFSHILNGDMRINVRLIAVLAGLILLSQIGGYMMRSTRYSRGKSTSSILSIGVVLFVLGYLGLFFGRLIKAAISRQREFLADAASVQFTRNPDGIAGALYKIQQDNEGSILMHAHAEDMSHMCFGETMTYRFTSLFATHPPLDERINAVNPGFVPPVTLDDNDVSNDVDADVDVGEATGDESIPSPQEAFGAVVTAGVLMQTVGNPTPAHMDYARKIHQSISPEVLDHAHQPLGARAVIYSLVLANADDQEFQKAQGIVARDDGEKTANAMNDVLEDIRALGVTSRLPLVELTFPALGRLHQDQKEDFIDTLMSVIKSDNKYTLFEFALLTIIRKHLMPDAGRAHDKEYSDLSEVHDALKTLILLFSKLGGGDRQARVGLYERTMSTFNLSSDTEKLASTSVEALTQSLMQLDRLTPLLKRPVINACADCVVADGKIDPVELELLRATCAALDSPMPPLLPAAAA